MFSACHSFLYRLHPPVSYISLELDYYLALINRAGGLYERILTKVVSTDRTQ